MVLTACGNKAAVKSEKPAQTVLEQTTPVSNDTSSIQAPSMGSEAKHAPAHSYAKRSSTTKAPVAEVQTPETKAPEKPAPAPARTPIATTQKKSGYALPIILLLLIAVAIGFYFWSKGSRRKSRPLPPHGGLSPVSGFTAMKDRVQKDAPKRSSFWSKKTF